ncbi:di-heme oxidoredictase family protein [Hydrogenophaga sp.]|uniref:di-heme oxidoreductase family protein n=1 Tax=Hydrogenophaga sp. TaxID=1904254 RepID=UPI0025B8F837|nr:di-heme oxidoredictase family protein [Hydrogenophaga sp.]
MSVAAFVAPLQAATPGADPLAEKVAGDATVWATGQNAFSFPAANLPDAERTRFVIGNSFFKRNWVEAPASTTARDGLGPNFIARSCAACHLHDGRGAPPPWTEGLSDQPPLALLLRLSVPGVGEHGGPKPDPVYGDQLNTAAVQGVKPEGRVRLRWEPLSGKFADGTRYTLHKPVYEIDQLGYGPMAPDALVSPRVAPQVIGVGLLEAIPEAEILANAKAQADAGGAVSGRPNRVWDAVAQREMVGRFGWKANVATIAHQTAGAFLGDIGITSTTFPNQNCTPTQTDCQAAPAGAHGTQPELDPKTFEEVVFYQAVLAPPARRAAGSAQVLKGQRLFAQAQCAVCHRPTYTTAEGPFPRLTSKALSGQKIWPYTDLLLHDMGEALADGRPDFLADGSEWKTPPLWGVGLFHDVNGHRRLMHDGRADGVLEAILWHGGEAEASKQQVLRMKRADRDALVKFVESL